MISVIVPVYNVKQYLNKCVDSVLRQTKQDFELILVDDGSTDGCDIICDELAKTDERIRVIHQQNQGLSAARNTGLKAALGEWIAYIDSDDWIESRYLEVLYRNAIECRAQVSVCSFEPVWEKQREELTGRPEEKPEVLTGREAAKRIVRDSQKAMITAWGKLYHNSLAELLEYPVGKLHEDEFVTYRVLYAAEKAAVSTMPLYKYMQRPGSIIHTGYSERRLDKLEALKEACIFFSQKADDEMAAAALKRYLINIQIAWYRIRRSMPEKKELEMNLQQEWEKVYQGNRDRIFQAGTRTDKITILVFKVSPKVYGMIAGIYIRIFPERG